MLFQSCILSLRLLAQTKDFFLCTPNRLSRAELAAELSADYTSNALQERYCQRVTWLLLGFTIHCFELSVHFKSVCADEVEGRPVKNIYDC